MPKSMDSNLSTFFLNDIRIIQASSLSPSLYLEPYTHEVHHSLIQTHTLLQVAGYKIVWKIMDFWWDDLTEKTVRILR